MASPDAFLQPPASALLPGREVPGHPCPLGTALVYAFSPLTLAIPRRDGCCQYRPSFTDRELEHREMEPLAQSHTAGRWRRQDSSQDACHQVALTANMSLSPYSHTSVVTPATGPCYSPALTLAVRIVMAASIELLLLHAASGSLHAVPPQGSRAGCHCHLTRGSSCLHTLDSRFKNKEKQSLVQN